MTRAVIWSPAAARDFLELVAFIAEDSPETAKRVGGSITGAVNNLGIHSTGRPGRVFGTYEKSVAGLPYVIAYEIQKVEEGRVVIHRIIHTARDRPKGRWPE
jgi:plasmid stabilization system protein ParE